MTNPYASQQRQALDNAPPQAAEGWAMIEMARRLDETAKQPAGADQDEALRDLVRRNWRMWTLLQAALVDPECGVPLEIRQNLLSLANFVDKRSVDVLAEPTAAKVEVLVNINRQIGAGLMGNPSDDPEEAERLRREHAAAQPAPAASGEAAATPAEPGPPAERASVTTDTEI